MTTLGLLHGGAHTDWVWGFVRPELERRGHRVIAPTLPFDDPVADVATIAELVAGAVCAAEDLVLVAHSLGGSVLPAAARASGARGMVFLSAVVPEEGTSIAEQNIERAFIGHFYDRSTMDEQGRVVVGAELARDVFYHDCAPDVVREAISNLRPQSSLVLTETMPAASWPPIPAGYILCTQDRLIDPVWSRDVAQRRFGRPAIEIPGSHSPMLSRPPALADALSRCVSELATLP